MKWPFSGVKQAEKTAGDLELEKLENERKLGEAKLRAAEVDEQVITAAKVNALFKKLRDGCKNEEEFDRRLRHYAELSDVSVEYLRQEFSFKSGVQRLESLDDENIKKLEKLAGMDKERKRMLGFNK